MEWLCVGVCVCVYVLGHRRVVATVSKWATMLVLTNIWWWRGGVWRIFINFVA